MNGGRRTYPDIIHRHDSWERQMLDIDVPERSRDTQVDEDVLSKSSRTSVPLTSTGHAYTHHGLLRDRTSADLGNCVSTHPCRLKRPRGLIRCDPADVLRKPKRQRIRCMTTKTRNNTNRIVETCMYHQYHFVKRKSSSENIPGSYSIPYTEKHPALS